LGAAGYGSSGELWSKTEDEPWQEVAGPFAAGEDLYHAPLVLVGPAGTIATWRVGYWPSSHQTQSPVFVERGDVGLSLFRLGSPGNVAAIVSTLEGDEIYSVPFVDFGTSPPDTVVVDRDAEIVRFLHPDDGTVLAELGFDEVETLLDLEWPARHGWWSTNGVDWAALGGLPEFHLGAAAVGKNSICVAQNIERADLPLWVRSVGFEDTVQQVVEMVVLPLPLP
jgi:hypothetical protein